LHLALRGSKVKFKSNNLIGDNCNRIGVLPNFMYSKVTSKSIIKMIIELKAVCRVISFIESSVTFAKTVEKLWL